MYLQNLKSLFTVESPIDFQIFYRHEIKFANTKIMKICNDTRIFFIYNSIKCYKNIIRSTLPTRNYFAILLGQRKTTTGQAKGCDYPKGIYIDQKKEKVLKLKQRY